MNAVEMIDIVKEYPGVLANDHVSLTVREGEIHGLVGENGAGKSTIMNQLYGMQRPTSGTIRVYGKEVQIHSPREAIALGIGMVHQHFMLAPSLSVLQNIILGNQPKKGPFIDRKTARRQVQEILDRYAFQLDLDARVYQLSVGQMQRVEIVKALYRGAKILILDEPTAVLTPQEVEELIKIMRRLREQGCSIIIITHKLKEVMAATDRITIMRKGVVTGRVNTAETNETELANLMVGREVNLRIPKGDTSAFRQRVLEVRDLEVYNERGQRAVDHVSFSVKQGEILGVCGVEGNGQTELVNALTGLSPASGSIRVNGAELCRAGVRARREHRMSHIPEDRMKVGGAKTCSITENLMLDSYYTPDYCRGGVLDYPRMNAHAGELIERFAVKVPNGEYPLGTLSGGNIQKVILARELDADPEILIAAQPTRGVDIGAIEYIRKQLVALRDSGKAILLVSAELEEILSLSDRIIVMYEGEIVGTFCPEETTEEELGLYMTGSRRMELDGGAL